ncbi:hypothetical protein FN846DRAFT_6620 [Sphaerosporella brunnea]|uniref:Uncharacterized protein n=1 Tax=Sphaerosporella brunnea TaxID=1250544 RepID=A0A5J5FCD2_9PEZI|nr:hypothetical protein FN846DRAFT_6620 [Sphaerosporella brunnea]
MHTRSSHSFVLRSVLCYAMLRVEGVTPRRSRSLGKPETGEGERGGRLAMKSRRWAGAGRGAAYTACGSARETKPVLQSTYGHRLGHPGCSLSEIARSFGWLDGWMAGWLDGWMDLLYIVVKIDVIVSVLVQ